MKKIPLTQGKVAIVDDDDYDKLVKHKWYAHKEKGAYYAIRRGRDHSGKQTTVRMSRVIMNCPSGMQVDHRDYNSLDNQKSNMRICTPNQNRRHRRKNVNKIFPYKGVYIEKGRRRCYAKIGSNGKEICLGSFENPIEAARAYDQKARELFGEFAATNFNEAADQTIELGASLEKSEPTPQGGMSPPSIDSLHETKEHLDKELCAEDDRHNREIEKIATALDKTNTAIKEKENA